MGHYGRCVLLAKKIEGLGLGFSVEIYCHDEENGRGDAWFFGNRILKYLQDENLKAVVIDSYQAGIEVYRNVIDCGIKLLVLDDIGRLDFPCESVILNGGINTKKLYNNHPQNLVYAGLEYMINDSIFLESGKRRKIKKNIEKILVCFGGSDKENYTQKVLDLLKGFYYEIVVVLGACYPHELHTKARILKNITSENLAEEFMDCDVAIIAGGRMVNEVISSRLPALVFSVAKNQDHQVGFYDAMKVIKKVNLTNLIANLKKLDFVTRYSMSIASSKIKFGNELQESLKKILKE
ncbi:hypothetical protein [Helicobacter anatolicus]|uniref:hypothetical protein n=1 Tax=Helicobacter anatolicus TaxID=2905874 RepID=UPI001E38C0B2|nr:hypothetical protein [Helicobacter anatolicus]MCE3038131.1 hypothetical protein [Helicobacter anatolicus]